MATKDLSTNRTVSFKSVGEKIDQYNASVTSTSVLVEKPIGIKTPIELNYGNLFKMHYSLTDQIADNLRNLILTNKGERIGNPAYGSNLKRVQYDTANKEDAEIAMMAKISSAVRTFMPFVNLVDFTTTQLPETAIASNGIHAGYQGGALLVRVTYTVAQAFSGTRGLQLILPMAV